MTIVMATPVPELVEGLAHRVLLLHEGKVVACDTVEGLRSQVGGAESFDAVVSSLWIRRQCRISAVIANGTIDESRIDARVAPDLCAGHRRRVDRRRLRFHGLSAPKRIGGLGRRRSHGTGLCDGGGAVCHLARVGVSSRMECSLCPVAHHDSLDPNRDSAIGAAPSRARRCHPHRGSGNRGCLPRTALVVDAGRGVSRHLLSGGDLHNGPLSAALVGDAAVDRGLRGLSHTVPSDWDPAALVVAYALAQVGWVFSLRWCFERELEESPGLRVLRALNGRQRTTSEIPLREAWKLVGWPFDKLRRLENSRFMSPNQWLTFAVVVGLWAHAVCSAALAESVDDAWTFVTAMEVVCALLAFSRLCAYVWEYAPPVSLLGRLTTGRLIIPGYDRIFVSPILACVVPLGIVRVLPPMGASPPLTAGLVVIAAVALVALPGPRLHRWRCTGTHRMWAARAEGCVSPESHLG